MTQKDKELLMKDLSARLLYGVKFNYCGYDGCDYKVEIITSTFINDFPIEDCKPYLRSMSNMTEEEYKELKSISPYYGFAPYKFIGDWCPNYEMTDWLNAHHFDYRGLIESGLAIEVTEENNPYKE